VLDEELNLLLSEDFYRSKKHLFIPVPGAWSPRKIISLEMISRA